MKRTFLFLWLFLICQFSFGQINLVFRCDDYRMVDDTLQEKIIDLFVRHKLPLCICVIPADTSSNEIFTISKASLERWIQLKEFGLLDIGLHGFMHQNRNPNKYFPDSELAGLSYVQQLEIFQKGKNILESHLGTINYFVPPTNTINQFTMDALEESGFDILSGNVSSRKGFTKRTNLKLYPCTTEDFKEFADFYYGNRYKNHLEGTIIILFHPYTFKYGRYSLDELDMLLCSLKNNSDFHVCTFNALKEKGIPSYDGGLRNKNHRLMKGLYNDKLFYLNRPSGLLANTSFYLAYGVIGMLITVPVFIMCKRKDYLLYLLLLYLLVIAKLLFLIPVSYKISFFLTIGIGIVLDLFVLKKSSKR